MQCGPWKKSVLFVLMRKPKSWLRKVGGDLDKGDFIKFSRRWFEDEPLEETFPPTKEEVARVFLPKMEGDDSVFFSCTCVQQVCLPSLGECLLMLGHGVDSERQYGSLGNKLVRDVRCARGISYKKVLPPDFLLVGTQDFVSEYPCAD